VQRQPCLGLIDRCQENLGFGQEGIEIIDGIDPIRTAAPGEDRSSLKV
jgi:hypothetical protein